MLVNKGNKLSALTCMLALVVFAFAVPSTSVRAGIVYTIELTGDSTAIGSLEWAGDLSSDGAFLRLGTDINDLSITVAGVTFTEIAELGPFSDADGIVRLLSAGRIERRKVARLSSLGARHLRPCLKRFGTRRTIIDLSLVNTYLRGPIGDGIQRGARVRQPLATRIGGEAHPHVAARRLSP